MNTIFSIVQVLIAIFLIATILLQQRGSGLSGAFGGQGGVYYQKRGMEKVLLWGTVILSALFLGTALLRLFLF